MTPLANALHLLIAASLASPSARNPADCDAADLHCTAETNTAAARVATSDSERVQRLYRAHRAYMGLAKTGSAKQRPRNLCNAQELLAQAQALPSPESLRQRLVDTNKEMMAAISAIDLECRPKNHRKTSSPKRVAAAKQPKFEAIAFVTPPSTPDNSPDTKPSPPIVAPLSSTARSEPRPDHVVSARPAETHPAPTEPMATPLSFVDGLMPVQRSKLGTDRPPSEGVAPARPGRIVGGVVLMLASGALIAGMGVSLRARARVNGDIDALDAEILAERRMPTTAELLDVDQANDRYCDLTIAAAVTGVASLASLGISVALLATARRRGRVEAQPWAGTRSAGFSLMGRF